MNATTFTGLMAMAALYLTLLPSSLYAVFTKLPHRDWAMKTRKPLGLLSLIVSVIHGLLGVQSWSAHNLAGIVSGVIALFVLIANTINNQKLQKVLYAVAVLVLVHGLLLTARAMNMVEVLTVSYAAVMGLLTLESLRMDQYLKSRFSIQQPVVTLAGLPITAVIFFTAIF